MLDVGCLHEARINASHSGLAWMTVEGKAARSIGTKETCGTKSLLVKSPCFSPRAHWSRYEGFPDTRNPFEQAKDRYMLSSARAIMMTAFLETTPTECVLKLALDYAQKLQPPSFFVCSTSLWC